LPSENLHVLWFEGLEEGYVVALAGELEAIRDATRVIVALDMWQRCWLPEECAWWISDDAISLVARRIPEIDAAFQQWRERPDPMPGERDSGFRTRRYSGIRSRIGIVPPKVASAYHVLGLAPGAPAEQVTAARRRLARQHHPDAGGSHATMAAVNAAADAVAAWLAERLATV
jgi:hypothetical protein